MAPGQEAISVPDALTALAARYGPVLLDDPQRCEAMLNDVCPGRKREIFLLIAALKANIAAELLSESKSADLVIAHGTRRLRDNFGLSEESARWAAQSWVPASQAISEWRPPEADQPQADVAFDREWLLCCGGAASLSATSLGFVWYVSIAHGWTTLGGWAADSGVFAAGAALIIAALMWTERRMRSIGVPRHFAPNPAEHAWALTVEVLALLSMPAVPPGTLLLWAAEWIGTTHRSVAAHDLVFHLGRIIQSLILVAFLFFWIRTAVRLQGTVASSIVRQR